ncbi:hypothetical protein WICPIJ_003160 [Wickerhamomyces pijperi]|uniref:Uncharacterized protein n=1 Tax=Wickerhamomyces pijperi TaxID=599730 RepID=A0A9P8Q8E9_WICPI|nr:hypothetical protein WICPIJ_003160 [Wickerhamomyces pijperi]
MLFFKVLFSRFQLAGMMKLSTDCSNDWRISCLKLFKSFTLICSLNFKSLITKLESFKSSKFFRLATL